MKTIYSKFLLLCILIFAIGCRNEDKMSNTNVSAVEKLYAPADKTFYNLVANSSALFEWQPAHAEDNGMVMYEVAFDKEGGDFSSPVKVVPADGNGYKTTLNISFKDLNNIAELAGIKPEETGKLRWMVWSSKGVNVQKSSVIRTIEVQRSPGFPTPDELYITGSATEGGAAIASALPMKKIDNNVYEIYTQLKEGSYQFATTKKGTPDLFYFDANKLAKGGSNTYSGATKVYRIRIDFSNGTYKMDEVNKIELWFPPFQKFLFEYNYAGKGTWTALNKYIEFKQEGWGRDERYKFRYTFTSKEGTKFEEWYGSVNQDNKRPDGNQPASYWYLYQQTKGNEWDYTFKFKSEDDKANVNGIIDLSATAPAYTHSFTVAK